MSSCTTCTLCLENATKEQERKYVPLRHPCIFTQFSGKTLWRSQEKNIAPFCVAGACVFLAIRVVQLPGCVLLSSLSGQITGLLEVSETWLLFSNCWQIESVQLKAIWIEFWISKLSIHFCCVFVRGTLVSCVCNAHLFVVSLFSGYLP